MPHDCTLEVETLCRVIEIAKRYDTVTAARRALQNVLRMSDAMNAESSEMIKAEMMRSLNQAGAAK